MPAPAKQPVDVPTPPDAVTVSGKQYAVCSEGPLVTAVSPEGRPLQAQAWCGYDATRGEQFGHSHFTGQDVEVEQPDPEDPEDPEKTVTVVEWQADLRAAPSRWQFAEARPLARLAHIRRLKAELASAEAATLAHLEAEGYTGVS